jgi:endonuclease G
LAKSRQKLSGGRIRVAIGAAVMLAGGAAQAATGCQHLLAGGAEPIVVAPLPGERILICHRAFEALISGVARDPLWSAERLTADHVKRAMRTRRGRHAFRPELKLPADARAMPQDYGGYDRGHMTPAEDVPRGRARDETYSLANVVPQTAALNRGIWAGVEAAVRHLAERDRTLYVVTGPVLTDAGSRTRVGAVDIPLATWKAVYDPERGWAGAYLCDNTVHPACITVSIDRLAQVTGVMAFPSLPAAMTRRTPAMPPPEPSPFWPRSGG